MSVTGNSGIVEDGMSMVYFCFQGTLFIIGGMYFNVIVCGLLFRPTSFYKQSKEAKNKGPESETLLKEETKAHSLSAANGDSAGHHSQEMVRYRTTSTGSVVFGSIDSLHAVAVDQDNQSKFDKADDKHAGKGRNKCMQFLVSLIDFTVLKSYIVMLLVLACFLLFVGHFNFILFMPPTAASRGVTSYDKAYLISITGICDLCGRLLIGVVGDMQFIDRYKLFAVSSFFCGIAIFGFSMARAYWFMAVCVGFYGFLGGCYVAITAPVIVDMVGMKSMPRVYGVVLFIQGLGAAFGQPLMGKSQIFSEKGHYNSFQIMHRQQYFYTNTFKKV